MFNMRVIQNEEMLQRLRDLPERAQRNIRRKVNTELVPELQTDVSRIMESAPGPSPADFQFGTEKSRRYYFFLIRSNPELAGGEHGEHWIRSGLLETSWIVEASDRFRVNQITISNNLHQSTSKGNIPYPAKWVYGDFSPEGHIQTGWPQQARQMRNIIQAKVSRLLKVMWRESVSEALRGKG